MNPTSPTDLTTIAASTEASGSTYFLRRLGLILTLAAVVALVALVATGRLDTSRLGSLTGPDEATSAGGEVAGSTDGLRSSRAGGASTTSEPPAGPEATPEEARPPIAVQTDDGGDGGGDDDGKEGDGGDGSVPPALGFAPPRASRLVAQAPERLLDTRGTGGAGSAPEPGTTLTATIPAQRSAVALSVSLVGAERSGSVTIDGRAGAVEAVAVGGAGGTVTNLVIVPVLGEDITIRSSSGGHLVVDLVATFEPSPQGSADGRFVAIDPARITELETAIDGGQATLTFDQAVPSQQVTAFLAVVAADVGADGGVVRLGPSQDSFEQMLMWGPADESNRQRRGLVLIEPTADGTAALLYDGGAALTVDVVGYFTDVDAAPALTGLYVPSGPRLLYTGSLDPDSPVQMTGVEPTVGLGFVTVASRSADAGRLWSVTAPVDGGTIQVSSSAPVEADVTLLGVFVS